MNSFFLLFLTIHTATGLELVWEDNFDTFNYSKWNLEQGGAGWGNKELEYYTNRTENVRAENGNLVIEVHRENFLNRSFTSGRITTSKKLDFKYGVIEARIKLPNMTNGLWPAFWLLGAEIPDWPAQGEIDIFEAGSAQAIHDGRANFRFDSNFHWAVDGHHAGHGQTNYPKIDLSVDFNVWRVEWNNTAFKMLLNNNEYMWFDISGLPTFQKKFFLIFNVAVGGTYPNIQDPNQITAPLPAKLLVDYVRVYQ